MRWWALCSCHCWPQGNCINIAGQSVRCLDQPAEQGLPPWCRSRGQAAQRGCRLVCAAQMSVWKSVSCPSGQVWQIAECMVLCCSAGSAAPHANGAEVPCIGARSVQSAPCLAACSCDSCPAPALQGTVCPLSGRQGSGLSGAKLPVAQANHPVLQWLTISATATEKADLAAIERRI